MSLSNKLLIISIILLFAGNQIYLLITQFADTRIIEVRKEIYESNEKDYLKGYQIENAPFEQFDLRVQPKSFWDYLLITNSKGNLLSVLFKLSFCGCLAWYIYRLDSESVFSWGNYKWASWAFLSIAVSFFVYTVGLDHTKDFWNSIYSERGQKEYWKYDFFIETKYDKFIFATLFWGIVVFLQAANKNYRLIKAKITK